jgi:hypothetical protein
MGRELSSTAAAALGPQHLLSHVLGVVRSPDMASSSRTTCATLTTRPNTPHDAP